MDDKKSSPLLLTRISLIVVSCLLAIVLMVGLVQVKQVIAEWTKDKPITADDRPEEYIPKEGPPHKEDGPYSKGTLLPGEHGPRDPQDKKKKQSFFSSESSEEGNSNQTDFLLILYTTLPICILTLYILFRLYRKKYKVMKTDAAVAQEEVEQDLQTTVEEVTVLKNNVMMMPTHPVRQWLAEWELSLPVQDQRKPWETINNWLHRIKKQHPPSVEVYENVRYGQKNVTDEELHTFQENFQKEQ